MELEDADMTFDLKLLANKMRKKKAICDICGKSMVHEDCLSKSCPYSLYYRFKEDSHVKQKSKIR